MALADVLEAAFPARSRDELAAEARAYSERMTPLAPWREWFAHLSGAERRLPDGRRIVLELPPLPALPPTLAATTWGASYEAAAPWLEPFWCGFWGQADDGCDPQAYQNGRAAAATRAGEAYRQYVEKCRAALRVARSPWLPNGWPDDQIP